MIEPLQLEPLKVTCTMSDCEADLHCFKFYGRTMTPAEQGNCRKCGMSLVDWDRVHSRDFEDVNHTFSELRREYIRHHFWHKVIDEKADKHARRKGRLLLRTAAHNRVVKSIGAEQPVRDGQQTPMEGNVIYYAQHATACCCRTCVEYWHAIPKGRELTEQEIEYFADLIMRYISDRMPHLRDEPEKIPRGRRINGPDQDR
ncbi:DUF4186 family protein [Pseudoxanthomonas sp. UTMC 1351]|uniref:DUF4186 family protein n=1 Tax=Pseudoxanthomonas sp. UTMC 1351 TaxID=2695853 RepID=UPI0034CFC558